MILEKDEAREVDETDTHWRYDITIVKLDLFCYLMDRGYSYDEAWNALSCRYVSVFGSLTANRAVHKKTMRPLTESLFAGRITPTEFYDQSITAMDGYKVKRTRGRPKLAPEVREENQVRRNTQIKTIMKEKYEAAKLLKENLPTEEEIKRFHDLIESNQCSCSAIKSLYTKVSRLYYASVEDAFQYIVIYQATALEGILKCKDDSTVEVQENSITYTYNALIESVDDFLHIEGNDVNVTISNNRIKFGSMIQSRYILSTSFYADLEKLFKKNFMHYVVFREYLGVVLSHTKTDCRIAHKRIDTGLAELMSSAHKPSTKKLVVDATKKWSSRLHCLVLSDSEYYLQTYLVLAIMQKEQHMVSIHTNDQDKMKESFSKIDFSCYHLLIIISDEKINMSIPTNIAYISLPTSFFQCGTQLLRSLDGLKTITKATRVKAKGESVIRDFCYGCREEKCCRHS
jgi:hypothetical protein